MYVQMLTVNVENCNYKRANLCERPMSESEQSQILRILDIFRCSRAVILTLHFSRATVDVEVMVQ